MDLKNKLFLKFLEVQGGGGSPAVPYGQRLSPAEQSYARAKWREFVTVRQVLGTCIACNRQHRPGEQRCTVHRNLNRAKCKAWAHENRDERLAEYRRRVKAGVCTDSPDHGPAFEGHNTCRKCYLRARSQARIWRKQNSDRISAESRKRREALVSQGLCAAGASHGPAQEGYTHCRKCRRKERQRFRQLQLRTRQEQKARGVLYFDADGKRLN